MFMNDSQKWTAIARRDHAADGAFVYSVDTTGVYCRPGCPSRLPRRDHVRFHVNAKAAARAGFRPCKRCKPNEASAAERQAQLVAKACQTIEESDEWVKLDVLADEAGLSPHHFHRLFKSVAGVTPRAYGEAHRAKRVREELVQSPSVTDAIYGAGFSSSSRFYEKASKTLGMTPTDYRAGGDGLAIRYGFGQSALGIVLVAATARGICFIALGDAPDELERDLRGRFSKAILNSGDTGFERWIAEVVAFVDVPKLGLGLPLDLRGTAFQIRVWQALQDIPLGKTASYGAIAARLGAPKSARAVARACATNPVAVAVPCHRVVGRDGALTGYRWGLKRKRTLLDREAKA
jgi:AraC family transcriptional regulator, regulatory protein of adaptative response / methylated-DNA-[protein]-cysteine methyltransferase